MRRHFAIMAAAAMTVGAFSLSAPAQDMGNDADVKADVKVDGQSTADKVGDKTEKVLEGQGLHGTAAAPDAEGIRDVLASTTEAALTKGGFDDLVERLNDHDRNRIGNFAEKEFTTLDGKIDQIRTAWKDKYGEDFDIKDEEKVYPESFARIIQGELGDQARLAGERVTGVQGEVKVGDGQVKADADVNRTGDAARTDGNRTGVDMPGNNAAADKNLNDPGRNIANVHIMASHGMQPLTLNLIHEMPDNWRIDVSDTLTGQQLHDNLLAHLNKIGDSASWPADKAEAYRLVTHHVLAALSGKQVTDMQPGQTGMMQH